MLNNHLGVPWNFVSYIYGVVEMGRRRRSGSFLKDDKLYIRNLNASHTTFRVKCACKYSKRLQNIDIRKL